MECCKTLAPAFQVMVASRERLQCDEIYLAVLVEIQGYPFQANMYSLDLQGSDVALGMQWLQSLGKVLHDWLNLTMEFWNKDHKFVLQGEHTGNLLHKSLQSSSRLATNGVKFYVMQVDSESTNITPHKPTQEQASTLEELLICHLHGPITIALPWN